MGIKTIVFDLGNVFVKVDPAPSILKIQRLVPDKSYTEVYSLIDRSEIKKQYELGEIDDQAFFDAVKDRLQIDFSYEFFRDLWQDFLTPIQSMIDLLPHLKVSRCLVLLSDTNPMHVAVCRDRFNFLHWFDHSVFSYEIGYMKPDPKIFRTALERSQSKPEDAIFIDDKLENVKGAEDVGIQGFLFKGTDHFRMSFPEIIRQEIQ